MSWAGFLHTTEMFQRQVYTYTPIVTLYNCYQTVNGCNNDEGKSSPVVVSTSTLILTVNVRNQCLLTHTLTHAQCSTKRLQ